jgi:hypothetical protein
MAFIALPLMLPGAGTAVPAPPAADTPPAGPARGVTAR